MKRPPGSFSEDEGTRSHGAFATNSARVLVITALIFMGAFAAVGILRQACDLAGCQ